MPRPVLVLLVAGLVVAGCSRPSAPPAEEQAVQESPTPVVPTAQSADTPETAAGRALGVGDQAPDFVLPNAMGQDVRLSELLDRGPVVLTFYRGAWCPYCNNQLRDYQDVLGEIEAAGATLVAVSPQAPDGSMTMAERNGLAFPVLSDVGNEVSRQYGLVFTVDDATRERYRAVGVDLAAVNGTDAWELPVPATYVVEPDGTIRAAFVEADYTQRASARQVLDALRRAA
ncbi:peroxiredoxin-like family protein [Rubrivirga sp. S365]|uniref:thioredoxin-dependent peroxiredoxin n=1 Tax=Rubrivirga litoralis TaxID=3075598 RepID=A0ABU3BMQ4_9BACT|nr:MULTISPECIES: peroxiredoxin-like family protein [unclassified Rubrivirga]MDT0630563.1 peroxiredoxin-like family protein [Rubrivirga sp. F394]MDT7857725.1 peroxiredoxin-like family protein [Rubrivirga sp. S365]